MGTYEQKYREALKKAEAFYNSATTEPIAEREVLANIFPELKESDDERIRKEIISALKYANYKGVYDKHLAWLENQGTSYTKRDVDDAYLQGMSDAKNELEKQYEATYQIRQDIATFIFNYRGDIKDRAKWMNYLGIKVSLVEKQGEQKDFAPKSKRMISAEAKEAMYTTEVETGDGGIKALVTGKVVMPKFKVGDWIAINSPCKYVAWKITDIVNEYANVVNEYGEVAETAIYHLNDNYHLWTIQDAKPGDVLQLGVVTAIFKEYIGNGICKCYCSVCNGEFEIPSQDGADNSYGCHNATPATKEHRDTLIKAMTDAGYTFDYEKKELKKIEQKPTWSEEDERMCQYIVNDLKFIKELVNDPHHVVPVKRVEKEIDWMESLKERNTWKPSDEQMRALHDMNITGNISYAGQGQTLIELYNDLKKLREE